MGLKERYLKFFHEICSVKQGFLVFNVCFKHNYPPFWKKHSLGINLSIGFVRAMLTALPKLQLSAEKGSNKAQYLCDIKINFSKIFSKKKQLLFMKTSLLNLLLNNEVMFVFLFYQQRNDPLMCIVLSPF